MTETGNDSVGVPAKETEQLIVTALAEKRENPINFGK
jgi:hypothetical protein